MSLCVLIGPEGHFGDTWYYMKRCMGRGHEGQGDTKNKKAETVDDDLSGIEIREWKASDSMRDSEASLETVKVVTL